MDFKLYEPISKTPSIIHFCDLSLLTDKSALLPKISEIPPTNIDFPAPVSPVITVKPLLKETESSSINK